jgi:sugar phosphate isomerase/epimerase
MRRASLNLATLGPARFDRKLYAAFHAGFAAVGLVYDELARVGEEGLEELRLSELAVSEIVGVGGWMDTDRASRSVAIALAERMFELAAELRCQTVVAWPDRGVADLVAAASDFHELCRLASPHGVRVGLEFEGWAQQIKDVASAWGLVEAAEAANGGLVLDTFHLYRGGSTGPPKAGDPDGVADSGGLAAAVEMLEEVPGEKILLVQISDCMDLPRHELGDRHRVYPGQGAIGFEPLLGALSAKGYSGYWSLELPNEDYWQEDPVMVAQDGMRALRRLQIV